MEEYVYVTCLPCPCISTDSTFPLKMPRNERCQLAIYKTEFQRLPSFLTVKEIACSLGLEAHGGVLRRCDLRVQMDH